MVEVKRTEYPSAYSKARGIKPWLKLAAGVGVILLYMYWAGPILLKFSGLEGLAQTIEVENIRATAIYYTDLDHFARAEAALRDHMAFMTLNALNKAAGKETKR